MRCAKPAGTKGSLRWIQAVIGLQPRLLTDAIRAATRRPSGWDISWVSPLKADDWAEYRDGEFLRVIRMGHLHHELEAFWPTGGPQWDALGTSSDGGVVLVEAKSHHTELKSTCQAREQSLATIRGAVEEARRRFKASEQADWLAGYYQYANRLAHLHFFQCHGVPVQLAFVYFVNDRDMKGPASAAEWKRQLEPVYRKLGLTREPPGVCNVFIDVGTVPPVLSA